MERAGDRSRSAIPGLGYVTEPKRIERKGLTIHIDGVPTLQLNSWVKTRPQDWNPTARAILWPELAARVMERAAQQYPQITGNLRR